MDPRSSRKLDSDAAEAMLGCIGMLCALPLGFAVSIYIGWLMSYWWLWFAVPLGAPLLSMWHIMGFRMMLSQVNLSTVSAIGRIEKSTTPKSSVLEQCGRMYSDLVRTAILYTMAHPFACIAGVLAAR